MTDYYMALRHLHILAVALSGSLFLLRGLGIFAAAGWPKASPVRYLSYAIDTVLLVAAILLTIVIQQYPFVQAWLTVKVVLLIVYIALGILAFRDGRPLALRIGFWLLALATFLFIISVAVTHHPLGIFSGLI
mgnify:FL=1